LISHPDGYPFQRLSVDLYGPFFPATSLGNNFILTCKDTFTKWIEAFPLKDANTENILHLLINNVFARHGLYDTLVSDNGPQFNAKLFGDTLRLLGVNHYPIPTYNAKSNPVERTHRDMNSILRSLVSLHRDWEQCLGQTMFAIRTSPHSSTGFSPFYALYGRKALTPSKLHMGLTPSQLSTLPSHVRGFVQQLITTHRLIRANTRFASEKSRKNYTQKQPHSVYTPGDLVYLYFPHPVRGIPPKFATHWFGPYQILEQINDLCYSVRPVGSWTNKRFSNCGH
jgi:hypothetical protein